MKKLIILGVVSLMILSGVALAEQSGEPQKGSSTRGMMQEMMGDESGMGGMMGQMSKMMDQCAAAHESMHGESGKSGEGQKK